MNTWPSKYCPLAAICLIAAMLAFPCQLPAASMFAGTDLTGLWTDDDGAIYYLRQIGNTVWWAGFDPDPFSSIPASSNAFHRGINSTQVFQGVLSGNTLTGDWSEVPRQAAFNLRQGTLKLQLVTGSVPGGFSLQLQSQTGGLTATSWTRTSIPPLPCTSATGARDPYCLFGKVLKNQTETIIGSHESLLDNLKPYKESAVIFGTVESPYAPQSLPASCSQFFSNNADDADLNFDVAVDRANLDAQPGFWTDGWVNNASNIQGKLNAWQNAIHCETIAYGRQDSQCTTASPVFLPGWGESSGNGSLSQGVPISTNALMTLAGAGVVRGNGLPMRSGSRVRIAGIMALDCGHGITSPCFETENDPNNLSTKNLEIHPVYSVDVLQDFTTARPQNVDLSGAWAASDVGTYYVRQSGNTIWWLGLSRDQGITFANVFHGIVTREKPIITTQKAPRRNPTQTVIVHPPPIGPEVITGQWASIPLGSQQGDGTLTLTGKFCSSLGNSAVPCDTTQPSATWNSLATQNSSSPVFSNPPNQSFVWQKLFDRNNDPTTRLFAPSFVSLGTVANGSVASRVFQVGNSGNAPLILSTIAGSIPALKVSPSTLTIPAGSSANISLSWLVANATSKGNHVFQAAVKLATNDPSAATPAITVQLTVKGGAAQ